MVRNCLHPLYLQGTDRQPKSASLGLLEYIAHGVVDGHIGKPPMVEGSLRGTLGIKGSYRNIMGSSLGLKLQGLGLGARI